MIASPDEPPRPIHLGFRSGTDYLITYLNELRSIGINHVALNLRFNHADIADRMKRIVEDVMPIFNTQETGK